MIAPNTVDSLKFQSVGPKSAEEHICITFIDFAGLDAWTSIRSQSHSSIWQHGLGLFMVNDGLRYEIAAFKIRHLLH